MAAACAEAGAPIFEINLEMFETNSLARLRVQGWMAENSRILSATLDQFAPPSQPRVDTLPDGVVIKDIDVLFNPDYQVDVLKILMAARKRKRYSVIWPGRCEDGKLIYKNFLHQMDAIEYIKDNLKDGDVICYNQEYHILLPLYPANDSLFQK